MFLILKLIIALTVRSRNELNLWKGGVMTQCLSNGTVTRVADKSLARPGMKQARKHVRDARDFNKIETRAVIKFLFLQGKAPKEIDDIVTETLACFLSGRAKDISAPILS